MSSTYNGNKLWSPLMYTFYTDYTLDNMHNRNAFNAFNKFSLNSLHINTQRKRTLI